MGPVSKWLRWGVLGLAALLVAAVVGYLVVAAPSGTGLAAKHVCSLVYVSGLDVTRARELYIDAIVQPMTAFLRLDDDPAARTISARGFGIWRAHAQFRDGLGCTLLHDGTPLLDVRFEPITDQPLARATDAARRTFDLAALDVAGQTAFENPYGLRNTLALAVVHDGQLVWDRYAPGIDQTTPLPGWSMTKAITTTLAGILVRDGRLDVTAPGVLANYRRVGGAHAAITMDQLLRMTSGIDLVETNSGADPTSTMLFRVPDAATFTARRSLKASPGAHWEYMSGNTVLAMRGIMDLTGGDTQHMLTFMRDRLFAPLGIGSAVMETDQSGTFVGSSYMLASTHDWAKLGMLLLDGGRWQGAQIVDPDWIDYMRRHTPESGSAGYGAGIWLNGAASARAELPEDTYLMRGFQGQYVFVVPSERLVVVRLGASRLGSGATRFVSDVIAARRSQALPIQS